MKNNTREGSEGPNLQGSPVAEGRALDSQSPAEKESNPESQNFHEGGLSGWATAIGAFLVQFSTYGYSISFGVYQDFYAQTYITSETSSTIAWIGSTNAFLFEICGLVAGRLYDRGYFYHLIYGASLLQAFSLFMLSLAHPDSFCQVFLTQGVGSGCAAGLLYIPSMAVLSQHFNKRRDQVMAFASSGAYLGAVVHPIMLNNTINGHLGFANGVRASAGLVSGVLLVACLLMRTRLPPPTSYSKFFATAKKCTRDNAFIFGCLGLTIFVVAFYYPLFYLQLAATTHGLGNTFSFYSLVIMNTSSFFGQLCTTTLVEYLSVPTVIILATSSCAIILFGLVGVHTVAGIVTFGVLYGYFSGIFLALWTPVMVLLSPDSSELGIRMGIVCAAMAIGGLVGPPISGALLTPTYIWWRATFFNGITGAVGCAMFVLMRHVLVRRSRAMPVSGPSHALDLRQSNPASTSPGP